MSTTKKAAKKAESKAAPEKVEEPKLKPAKASSKYDDVLANADPMAGDKDPVVIEWCRENMSAADFAAKYDGRIQ